MRREQTGKPRISSPITSSTASFLSGLPKTKRVGKHYPTANSELPAAVKGQWLLPPLELEPVGYKPIGPRNGTEWVWKFALV
jgi:hypothetical protein